MISVFRPCYQYCLKEHKKTLLVTCFVGTSGGFGGGRSDRMGAQGYKGDEGHEKVSGGGQVEEVHGCASGRVE